MKKVTAILVLFFLSSCAELQQIASETMRNQPLTNIDISNGLKQALEQGISDRVSSLTEPEGFFRNELVRIMLPEELQRVDSALRSIGLGSLADEGLKLMNRAAEEAVAEATPIFIDAIRQMSIQDARGILMGEQNAATQYLQRTTQDALMQRFQPIIESNFNKVGANEIWSNIITRYNRIPLMSPVNPDLTDYVTEQALSGVYTMVEVEEKEIRSSINARKTDLLRRVFALQD